MTDLLITVAVVCTMVGGLFAALAYRDANRRRCERDERIAALNADAHRATEEAALVKRVAAAEARLTEQHERIKSLETRGALQRVTGSRVIGRLSGGGE